MTVLDGLIEEEAEANNGPGRERAQWEVPRLQGCLYGRDGAAGDTASASGIKMTTSTEASERRATRKAAKEK